MPTSELSDALNPHIIQTRQRSSVSSYAAHLQPVAPPPQEYVPHRSELEIAISEPPPPPPRIRTQPSPEGIQAVQELLRVLSTTREAQEIERKRRLAWEQELEAKYTQRQAETERLMFDMRQEISSLRNFIANSSSSGFLHVSQFNGYSSAPDQQSHPLSLPISPVSQPPSGRSVTTAEGFSNPPPDWQQPYYGEIGDNNAHGEHSDAIIVEPPSPAPSLTHGVVSAEPPSFHSESPSPNNSRKRQTPDPTICEDDNGSDAESSASPSERPNKRINHHDTRCLSIHQAMRLHILRLMQLDSDKNLPDGHIEGAPLEPHDAVRFVWDKTTKQCVHNNRMKTRILADLKSNRRLYKHVPDKDFTKKTTDAVFDQAFITLRQKFKAQRDALVAMNHKKREDVKALKARRLGRRKVKLSSRAEARLKLEMFEHVIFDGALQVDCMSEEESDNDESAEISRSSGILRVRGLPWRSSRLQRFYSLLDDEERLEKIQKPKRGMSKKERLRGPNKEGFFTPPKGVASWMISNRWISVSQTKHPDLQDVLKKIVVDPSGFDWDHFHALGEASDGDDFPTLNEQHQYLTHTSSLHNALAPIS